MILEELLKLLQNIKNAHPEASDAHVWAIGNDGDVFRIDYVGFDKRHKPARIKLEE